MNIGNRAIMYVSVLKTSHNPKISDLQVGCFIKITLEPSSRIILSALQITMANTVPRVVKTRKAMYVLSPT